MKSMALLPSRQSAKQVLSYYIGGSCKYGKASYVKTPPSLLQLKSFHGTGGSLTNGLSSSRRRISWVGTLSDKTSNRTTNTKDSLRSLGPFNGHSQLSPFYRMLSTSSSSNTSASKKQDENQVDINNSSTGNNAFKNTKDKSDTVQVTNDDEGEPQKNSFQAMFRRYGKVFVGAYLAVYVSTVLGLFMSVQSGQLDAMYIMSLLTGTSAPADPGGVADPDTIKEAADAMNDIVELLESYTLTRPVAPMVEQYPWTANLAIAWIATKFTEPIRFGVTVVVTPTIAKMFGYRSVPK
jgi:hypothetical protein